MKRLVIILIASVTMVGCVTPYRLTHPDNAVQPDTSKDVPITITKGDISVTAGTLLDEYMAQPGIGFLINNASKNPIRLSPDNLRISINGQSVDLSTYKWIKKYARMEIFAGALNAANASFNRSISGGYNMTETNYQLYRTDYGTKAMQQVSAAEQRRIQRELRNYKKRGDQSWKASRNLRFSLTRNFGLAKRFYLQDEKIPAGKGAFRIIWFNDKSMRTIADKSPNGKSDVNVKLLIDNTHFNFKLALLVKEKK